MERKLKRRKRRDELDGGKEGPNLQTPSGERNRNTKLVCCRNFEVGFRMFRNFCPFLDMDFGEYFDKYYGLNYEDFVGDKPCRFKYRNVPSNNFGLEVGEVNYLNMY